MPKKPSKRRPLSPEEQADAARLKAIYYRKMEALHMTQESLAHQMGFKTQGAVSQYMNGKTSMNNEIVIRFAYHLQGDPTEIRPTIWDSLPVRESGPDDLSPAARAFARRFDQMDDAGRRFLQEAADLAERRKE